MFSGHGWIVNVVVCMHTLIVIHTPLTLMWTQNHYYHTLERDREPRGVEVNLSIEKNDSTPSDSTPGGQI